MIIEPNTYHAKTSYQGVSYQDVSRIISRRIISRRIKTYHIKTYSEKRDNPQRFPKSYWSIINGYRNNKTISAVLSEFKLLLNVHLRQPPAHYPCLSVSPCFCASWRPVRDTSCHKKGGVRTV